MKILYLLSQRPDSTGSGIYTRALIKSACESGHRCFLLAACSGNDPSDTSEIPAERIDIIHFDKEPLAFPIPGMSDVMPYPSSRFADLDDVMLEAYEHSFDRGIRSIIDEVQPDIIHSNHLWLMSALAGKLAGDIPVIVSCHGSDLRQFRNCPHLRSRVVPGIEKAAVITALSSSQKEDIIGLYGIDSGKIEVIPNGFDPDIFYPAPKSAEPPVRLLYAGKLARAKGVPLLLETLSHPKLADLPFSLELAGSGRADEEAFCRESAAGNSKCSFIGALSPAALAERMRRAHIFVLPSYYEGLPLVLIEALASGCRLVTTSLPGTETLLADINEDWGSMVDLPRLETADKPYDKDLPMIRERLAQALAEQIRNRVLAQKPQPDCYSALKNSHSWKHVFSLLERIYRLL